MKKCKAINTKEAHHPILFDMTRIEFLKLQLEKAVEMEEYEKAAKIRDYIFYLKF